MRQATRRGTYEGRKSGAISLAKDSLALRLKQRKEGWTDLPPKECHNLEESHDTLYSLLKTLPLKVGHFKGLL